MRNFSFLKEQYFLNLDLRNSQCALTDAETRQREPLTEEEIIRNDIHLDTVNQ